MNRGQPWKALDGQSLMDARSDDQNQDRTGELPRLGGPRLAWASFLLRMAENRTDAYLHRFLDRQRKQSF